MRRFDDKAHEYILQHTSPEDEVLQKLFRETSVKILKADMLSGHLQGKTLEMISRMIKPDKILEIGTYTGYSAICLAKGLAPGGVLHTIESNDELIEMAREYFKMAGLHEKIIQFTGDALQIIPTLEPNYDLIFIDGDKREYPDYLKLTLPKLKPGGFLLADDVLWWGKATAEANPKDKFTQGIREFNELVKSMPDLEKVMLPIRDGLLLVQKTL